MPERLPVSLGKRAEVRGVAGQPDDFVTKKIDVLRQAFGCVALRIDTDEQRKYFLLIFRAQPADGLAEFLQSSGANIRARGKSEKQHSYLTTVIIA